MTLAIDGLAQGLNVLNFRVQNSCGDWSSIHRMLFFVPVSVEPSATVTNWEWWFDNEASSRRSGSGSLATVKIDDSISQLTTGMHYLNFRVRNSLGVWSPVSRFLLVKPAAPESSASLTDVEYWFDEDGGHRVSVKSSAKAYTINQDISQLPVGVHVVNVRVRNSLGVWSPVSRYLFYVPRELETNPSPYVGYYYSFNNTQQYQTIAESTDFVLQNVMIPIPDLQQTGNLNEGCTFTVQTSKDLVKLERTQPVTFSLRTMKKDGSSDFSIQKSFDMHDIQYRDAQKASTNGSWQVWLKGRGDFQVLGFDNLLEQYLWFDSSYDFHVRILNQEGQMMSQLHLDKPRSVQLPPGRYYAVVSHYSQTNSRDTVDYQLKIWENPSTGSHDDLQDYLNNYSNPNPDLVTANTYTRQFLTTDWEPLYVPFTMDYSIWSDHFEVAEIRQFNRYDDNSDGTADRQELLATVLDQSGDKTEANYPYLIRAKAPGTYTIYVGTWRMKTQVICSVSFPTQGCNIILKGSYANMKGLKSAGQYRLAGGTLWIPNSDSDVLPPYRWYATIRETGASSRPVILRIDDGTTSYAAMQLAADERIGSHRISDLSGRRVQMSCEARISDLKKGVYLIDGRKYIVK